MRDATGAEGGLDVTVAGVPVRVPRAEASNWRQAASGAWEPATLSALSALVRPGDVVVDIGAYVGVVTAVSAGLGARVHAYEPDPVAREQLEMMLAANPRLAGRVTVHPEALGTSDGAAHIASDRLGDSGARITRDPREGAVVAVRDARLLASDVDLRRCTLVKIDVEGAEYGLLPRMLPVLKQARPAILLSTHTYHFRQRFIRWPRLARGIVYRLVALPAQARLLLRARSLGAMLVPAGSAGGWRGLTPTEFAATLIRQGEKEFLILPRGRERGSLLIDQSSARTSSTGSPA